MQSCMSSQRHITVHRSLCEMYPGVCGWNREKARNNGLSLSPIPTLSSLPPHPQPFFTLPLNAQPRVALSYGPSPSPPSPPPPPCCNNPSEISLLKSETITATRPLIVPIKDFKTVFNAINNEMHKIYFSEPFGPQWSRVRRIMIRGEADLAQKNISYAFRAT